jgi:hypothetical protein
MTVVGTTRARWLRSRINVENDARHFLPIGVVFFSIEETHIGDRMLLVIRRQRLIIRSQIGDFGMMRWHARNSYWSRSFDLANLAAPELLSYRLDQPVYGFLYPSEVKELLEHFWRWYSC